MQAFADLLNRLYYTHSHLAKARLLKAYLAATPDPDRGYAMAIIARNLSFPFYKPNLIYQVLIERVDPLLFKLSYDEVGDYSETVALMWPWHEPGSLPSLTVIIETLLAANKEETKQWVSTWLNAANAIERWALLKIATGELRIGVSARFLKQVLAEWGHMPVQEIEEVWHAVNPPYTSLFAWLLNQGEKPSLTDQLYFHPVMLAHPLEEKVWQDVIPSNFCAEWKYDGIRVQVVKNKNGQALFSRTGDDISATFPDIASALTAAAVLDGELVIKKNEQIATFNELQQRLNRKNPSKKLIESYPAHVIIYDILTDDGKDLRALSFEKRRAHLTQWFAEHQPEKMSLSPLLEFEGIESLRLLRGDHQSQLPNSIEGLMLKHRQSPYIPGRPKGHWYKWKRDPFLMDAVLMYAQRGSGKRSSYYSDFTFGLWQGEVLLPVGKAYFGFTDDELKMLDNWVRKHTIKKFGPVCELDKELVLEVAFEAVQFSSRHKSGFALRFPRINRIRWDKPANEADHLSCLSPLVIKSV